MDTVRESALEVDSGEKNPLLHRRVEPASVLCLAFQCGCQCLGVLMCTQMLMHAITYGGYVDTVRKSALKVDLVRTIPCCTGCSNLHRYCAWLFSWTLYQLLFRLCCIIVLYQLLYYCTHPDLIMDIRLLLNNFTGSGSVKELSAFLGFGFCCCCVSQCVCVYKKKNQIEASSVSLTSHDDWLCHFEFNTT